MTIESRIRSARSKAVGGKKDRCRKGKSCSATCISTWKACLVEMSSSVSESLSKIKGNLTGTISGVRDRLPIGDPEREKKRYFRVKEKKIEEMKQAALERDSKRYNALQKSLYQHQSKLGRKNGDNSDGEWGWGVWKKTVTEDFMGKLRKKFPEESTSIERTGDRIQISKKVGDQTLSLILNNGGASFGFTVNATDKADPNIRDKDKIGIIRETRKMFKEIVSVMDNGSAITVSAYEGDDRKEARIKAYKAFNFAQDGNKNALFGKVVNGKLEGTSRNEFELYMLRGLFNFFP